jgi:hypothetical protein
MLVRRDSEDGYTLRVAAEDADVADVVRIIFAWSVTSISCSPG